LLLGRACPVRLEGLRACMDLAQHDRVGLLLRHMYLELQGAWLGCQATLDVSLQVPQVLLALARDGFNGRHDCKVGYVFVPLSPPRIVEELNRLSNKVACIHVASWPKAADAGGC
jgi:hypothetical protein